MFLYSSFMGDGGGTAPIQFPQVKATNTSKHDSTTTTHVVSLPTGVQVGDLLIIMLTMGSTATNTISKPTGWEDLFNNGASNRKSAAFYRVATGSEGGTVSVTSSVAEKSAHQSFRIDNYQGVPEAIAANGGSATPDVGSLAPSWGADDALWIAFEGHRNSTVTVTVEPANYVNSLSSFTGSPTNTTAEARCTTLRRELNASAEDVGAFTISSSGNWVAATIAIRAA